jgi:beta-galactosidase
VPISLLPSLLLALAPLALPPVPPPGRTVVPLDAGWSFEGPCVDGKTVRATVAVPHTWNATDTLDGLQYARGVGTYALALPIDASAAGRRLFLRFEGANTVADVEVNGEPVGRHRGGYTAFAFEITPFVVPGGENRLVVRVDNRPQPDVMPTGGDFNVYGGLHRPAWLVTTGPVAISLLDHASPGVSVRQAKVSEAEAQVEVTTVVSNGGGTPEAVTVSTAVLDASGAVVAEAAREAGVAPGETRVAQPLTISRPRLWQGRDDPYLYRVRVRLAVAGRIVDEVAQPLGLRTLRFDAREGFFLNGRALKVRGVSRHEDREGKGSALAPADHETDVALMLEMGANAVRLAHYPHPDHVLELCDRAGLLAWVEVPFVDSFMGGYADTPAFRENGKQQLRETIRQGMNHPSVFLWGLYNELTERGGRGKAQLAYVKELQALAKEEDPGRPTTAASLLGPTNPLVSVPDTIAFNRYFGWYNGQPDDLGPFLDEAARALPRTPIGVSEYGAGGDPSHHEQRPRRPFPFAHPWHPEEHQSIVHEANWAAIAERRFVWGSFVWNMFDFGVHLRREGAKNGRNDKGLVTWDRSVRKDAFFFYKAAWSEEPVLHVAGRRHVVRDGARTEVKVYANVESVSLRLNGEALPPPSGTPPVLVWTDVALRKGNNVVEASGRRGGRELADTVVWTYDAQPLVPAVASLLRWWIKPLYVASALAALVLFAKGFGDRPAGRLRTGIRLLFWLSFAWLLILLALWALGAWFGVGVFDYSQL